LNVDVGFETNASSSLSIMVYQKDDSFILHFVNYDYDYEWHDFKPQTQIRITLKFPSNVNLSGKTLKLMSPDVEQTATL